MKKLAKIVSAVLISAALAFSAAPAALADGGAGLVTAQPSLTTQSVKAQPSKARAKKTVKRPESTYITNFFSGRYSVKLTWNKVYSVDGYQVQCSASPRFPKSKTRSKRYSWNINGGTMYKTNRYSNHYVRVRTYKKSGKKKVYSRWSTAYRMVPNNWTYPVRTSTSAVVLARHQVCSKGNWCPSGYRIFHCNRYHQYQVSLMNGRYRYYYYIVKENGSIYEVRNGYWYYAGCA